MHSHSSETLHITSYSRPLKIAFLINPEDTSDEQINSIIMENLRVWGGRYNPIVPTNGESIGLEWWNILIYYDPDIIYSTIPLTEQLFIKLFKTIQPSDIIIPYENQDNRYGEETVNLSRQNLNPLGIGDLVQFQVNNAGITGKKFAFIDLDSRTTDTVNFVLRNFGSFHRLQDIENAFEKAEKSEIKISEISSPSDCLKQLRGVGIYPIEASRIRMPAHYNPKGVGGLQLVVGNTPLDLIYYWNRTLSSTSVKFDSFWISEEMAKDQTFLDELGTWISSRYYNQDHDAYKCKVVSYSLAEQTLENIASILTKKMCVGSFSASKLSPTQYPFFNYGSQRFGIRLHESVSIVPTNQLSYINVREPFFLQTFSSMGAWMVDIEVKANGANLLFPRRISLAQYLSPAPDRGFNRLHYTRITSKGHLSVLFNRLESGIPFRLPDTNKLYSLCFPRQEMYFMRDKNPPLNKLDRGGPSSTGKVLSGFLKLFEDIDFVKEVFDDPYWRAVFAILSGISTSSRSEDAIVLGVLEEQKLKFNSINLDDSEQLTNLASTIGHRLKQDKITNTNKLNVIKELTLKELKSRFHDLKKQPGEEFEFLQHTTFEKHVEKTLETLVNLNIFLMGTTVKCSHCGSREWVPLRAFGTKVSCDACFSDISQPYNPKMAPWSYRINDLISKALKNDGIYPLLLTLIFLKNSASDNFQFLPPQDVLKFIEWKEDKKEQRYDPVTDLDIVVFMDGKFIIGEVKTDPRGFKQSDVDNIKKVALDIFPDEILFTAEDGHTKDFPAEVLAMFNNLKNEVAELGIKVSWHLISWQNYYYKAANIHYEHRRKQFE